MTVCAEFAAPFITRWGEFFCCVLEKDHEGDHRAGGTCFAHGPYVMESFGQIPRCPRWPDCEKELLAHLGHEKLESN